MGAAGRPPPDEENMSASANKIATAHRLLPMCASYVVVLMLGLPAAIALADSPPKLNVAPSCDAAARGAISAGRDTEACMGVARTSGGFLAQNWMKYAQADNTTGLWTVNTGGTASEESSTCCLA